MKLRPAMLLVALVGFVAAASGIGVRATYGAHVSVDEPQYLLTAISLAEDRSLDISDELAHQRYRPFHEIPLDRQTAPLEDGSEISPHDPLLPALLAPPMELGGWLAAKLLLALVNATLAALLVWVAVQRFGARVRTALVVVGAFAASAPLAVYGNQVYPELPAALAVTAAIAALMSRTSARTMVGVAACAIVLPWLSVKYVPVATVIAVIMLLRLAKERPRALAFFAGGLGVAGALYLVAHIVWYGGLTVYAAGDHFVSTGEFAVVGTEVDLVGRATRLLGLLVDDKFGLLPWQPAFLLALPAAGAFLRARPRGSGMLAAIVAAGWLNATFVALTMQGWWWPGRQVVLVLPAVVLAIVWWADRSDLRRRISVAAGAIGVVTFGWLVVEGSHDRVTWVVDFFETTNPVYRGIATITPDYLDPSALTWVLHVAWIGVAAALVVLGYRGERGGPPSHSELDSELEPLVVEAEPDPDDDPETELSEPSTSRTPLPSSPQAAPVSAASAASAASAFLPRIRIAPPSR